MSPLSRLQQDIFALASIANLLLPESNQRLLDPLSLLNYSVHHHHIPVFFPSQFCSLSYNFSLNVQNLYSYNNCDSFSYLYPWYISYIRPTLPSAMEDIPSLHLFSQFPPSKQVLLAPITEAFPAFLAIFEAMATVVIVLYCFALGLLPLVLVISLFSLFLFYSLFNIDPD